MKCSFIPFISSITFIFGLKIPNSSITLNEVPKVPQSARIFFEEFDPKNINIYLYTRENKGNPAQVPLDIAVDRLKSAGYDSKKKAYFLFHGFNGNGLDYAKVIAPKILLKEDSNVFSIDWSILADAPTYLTAVSNCWRVGRFLGDYTHKLSNKTELNSKNIHAIGYSLGAHAAGYLGKRYFKMTGKKVGRITGLDPAKPVLDTWFEKDRLNKNDAEFVDVIHVNSGTMMEES